MTILDISRELMSTAPYPGDTAPRLHALATHENSGYLLQAAVMSLHAATHADAPLHFLKDGGDILSQPLEAFYGPCTVLTVPNIPLDASFFMRTAFAPRVLLRGPGQLLPSAVGYLYAKGVTLVGTDRVSIGSPEDEKSVHTALLAYGIAILENLDLSPAKDGDYVLSACPLKIAGAEAAPCRAVLIRN